MGLLLWWRSANPEQCDGYKYADGKTSETINPAQVGHTHSRMSKAHKNDAQSRHMRRTGWAGGGHSLHVTCDLTIASREHARFKQTDTDVASFDGGFGSVSCKADRSEKGPKYFSSDAHTTQRRDLLWATSTTVVDHQNLERVALEWAQEINSKSPTAQRMAKFAFN